MAADQPGLGRTAGAVDGAPSAAAVAGAAWVVVACVGSVAWGWLTVAAGEPWWQAVVNAVLLVAPATAGAALAARLPRNSVGWLLLASAAVTAVAGAASSWADGHQTAPAAVWAAWVDAVLWAFGPPLLPLIVLLFPDGRPVGRLGRWGVRAGLVGVGLVVVSSAFAPGRLAGFSSSPGPPNPVGIAWLSRAVPVAAGLVLVCLVAATLIAIGTLVLRWRRRQGAERLALATAGAPLLVALTLQLCSQAIGLGGDAVAVTATVVGAVGVPVGIWVAITRYRLYDLDLAVARTLAYSILALGLAGLFAITAAVVGLVAGGQSRAAVAIAAAVTATAFSPARALLITAVERSVLGPIGDPERAARLVSRRLAAIDDPDVLPARAAESVRDVLRLPNVVVLPRRPVRPAPEDIEIPLAHHGVDVGVLTAPGPVSAAGRRALTVVAEPVSAALHAATLAEAVRRSRTQLVTAVEEERRRLRRDLHDGLGPQLATLAMGLDAAHNRVAGTSLEPEVGPVLTRLRGHTDDMLASIRHIVSGLRPPALDEHGLTGALQLHAARVAEPAGLTVDLVADDVEALPAAVEVAAYHIAAEALLNVVRHADARRCRLSLARDDGLWVTVTDDGRGIPDDRATGIGTHSMRERAAALGGWLTVGPASGGGTQVRAWLPDGPR